MTITRYLAMGSQYGGFYLKQRFKNLLEIQHKKETIIQDRTIFEGVYVACDNNRKMGNMDQRDYEILIWSSSSR